MLTRAFLSLDFKIFWGGLGASSQTHLAARAFGARNLPRLVLKSDYGPDSSGLLLLVLILKHRLDFLSKTHLSCPCPRTMPAEGELFL